MGEAAGPELWWVRGMNGLASSIGKLLPRGGCLAAAHHIESISQHLHELDPLAL